LQAPRELFIQALNRNLNLSATKRSTSTGNYSGILSKLDRRFTDLDIRRAFTVFQLMTVLEEARHSIIIVEHDPMLYEDAAEMAEYISHALGDAAKESPVLLFICLRNRYYNYNDYNYNVLVHIIKPYSLVRHTQIYC
jgi:DNA polymerase I